MSGHTDWVAVDWGTSNVRVWGIATDGAITFSSQSDRGMGRISRAEYPEVLAQLISDEASSGDVVICGMAGARQGWLEAPYLATPASLDHLLDGAVVPEAGDLPYAVRILPGVAQREADSEDVMRGEETQLLGLLALRPGFEGTAILPGTHSKWVEIRDGRIVRFATAMTGELYEVLSQHSVLRHSFAGDVEPAETELGIAEGVVSGLERASEITSLMFRTRAAALLSDKGPGWCSGYLSGLLVGAEIGGHRAWLDGSAPVPLIGSARFAQLYGAALRSIGIESDPIEASDATVAGLKRARIRA